MNGIRIVTCETEARRIVRTSNRTRVRPAATDPVLVLVEGPGDGEWSVMTDTVAIANDFAYTVVY